MYLYTYIYNVVISVKSVCKGVYTVSPNKHGNSVTIFNLSTSVQLGYTINVL